MTLETAPGAQRQEPLAQALRPAALVVFGATGDLARRRILPALHNLIRGRALAEPFALVGVARDPLSQDAFRDIVTGAVRRFARRPPDEHALAELRASAHYVHGALDDDATYEQLGDALTALDRRAGQALDPCHHLAVPPELFSVVVSRLGAHGLARREGAAVRVVVEKPFGTSLADARRLNHELSAVLSENQLFRIDHFLGTQTVRNLLALRFANTLFEPTWNRHCVDHVEITAAEDLGLEGRGDYYDRMGAVRDVVQNHLLQLLCHVAMEAPVGFASDQVCSEKVRVLASIPAPSPHAAVRGQYTAGTVGGRAVPGYLEEAGVAPGSRTETFAALRLTVENWRWAGVPFYLRTGKRLARTVTEIAVTLQDVPHMAFARQGAIGVRPNQLILTIDPAEGVALILAAKIPGALMRLRSVKLDVLYELAFGEPPPEPYERLILGALHGDPMLFTRRDEVEQQWRIVEPLLTAWESSNEPPVAYPAGSQGPPTTDALLALGVTRRPI
jgi:glucose-6-phosphate 1-dehydrogenase